MTFSLFRLGLALQCVSHAAASLFNHEEALGMACALSAQNLFTTCDQEDYGCFCASSLYVYAVENCIGRESNYNSTVMGKAFDKFEAGFCETHNSHANTTGVWSPENQAANPTVSAQSFKLAYEGEKNNAEQKAVSVWCGLGLIFFWAAVASLATLNRLYTAILIRLFTRRMAMRRSNRLERLAQRYLFWPAIFNSRHMTRLEYFRGWVTFSFPSRFETLVVAAYVLMALIFMLTPYTFMNNDPLFQSRWKEMMRYSSDRAGIIATVQFPLLILFALRNNIFIWMTGWSYSTFNTYHRALARVNYLLLVIHAILKHIFSASYGGSLTKYYYPVPYFRYGCAAIGLFSLMIMLAMLRSRGYEFFYRMHQAMAIGGIVCSIYHLNGLGFKQPLWISIALWGADWTIRVGRILLFNVNFIVAPLPGARRSTFATARVYPGKALRVTITTPVRWVCKPGQYVFLHTNQWTFIGGHPFSVLGPSESGNGLELVLKVREGVTKRLYSQLDDRSCSPDYPVTIPVYVEGPYGHSAPVANYDEGLFVAGGIGITGVIGYMEEMVKSNRHSSFPKTVRLFWSVRAKTDVDPIAPRLARLASEDGVVIRIFQRQRAETAAPMLPPGNETGLPGEAYAHSDTSTTEKGGDHINLMSPASPSKPVTWDDEVEQNQADFQNRRMSKRNSMGKRLSQIRTMGKGHGRKISTDVKSFIEFAKSGDPDEDDEDDYGKDEFLENNVRGSWHSDEESSGGAGDAAMPVPVGNGQKQRNSILPSAQKSRHRQTKFMNAGFSDAIAERRLSVLNPFDDHVYPIQDHLDKDILRTGSRETIIERIYNLIEPVGMDVTNLIGQHFRRSDGSICVVGCGPDRMMDTLCWSCCEFVDLAKNGSVGYFEEAFRW